MMRFLLTLGPTALVAGVRDITVLGIRSNKTNPDALKILSGRRHWPEAKNCEPVAVQKVDSIYIGEQYVNGKWSQCFDIIEQLGYYALMAENVSTELAPVKVVGDKVCFPREQPKLMVQLDKGDQGDRMTLGWMVVTCGTEKNSKTTEVDVIHLRREIEVNRANHTVQKMTGVWKGFNFDDSTACFDIVTSEHYEKVIEDQNEAQVSPGSKECFGVDDQCLRVWVTLMALKLNSPVRVSWWHEWVTYTGKTAGGVMSTRSNFERSVLVLDDQMNTTDWFAGQKTGVFEQQQEH